MSIRTGTHHFKSVAAAYRYYGKDTAQQKLDEGAIAIGRPTLKEGQRLLIDGDGRYHIEEDEPNGPVNGTSKLTPEQRAQALDWYSNKNYDLQTIGQHFGLSYEEIRAELHTEGK
jgi:hypothetical protein